MKADGKPKAAQGKQPGVLAPWKGRGMDFTAIDFETANEHQTSACSIGIAVVEEGKVAFTRHHLIRPYPDYFHPFNVQVHGITKEDVSSAPTFAELWPEIEPYISGKIVAAHFAPFDMGVLMRTLELYNIDKPEMDILCSCRLAKSAFPSLGSHRLNEVCDFLGIPLTHHRADSDAEGSARIICDILEDTGIADLAGIQKRFSIIPGSIKNGYYKPCRTVGAVTRKDAGPFEADCPAQEFIDKDFVFSGTLQSMTRQKAFEVVSRGGGYPQKSITNSTDYLVAGAQDMARLKGAKASAKMRKALEMQKNGHPIKIVGEDEFTGMIDNKLHALCFRGGK